MPAEYFQSGGRTQSMRLAKPHSQAAAQFQFVAIAQ
jgi:hypothetical protein